ncbi:unnamed protein product [Ilex paraguariensis]|uniref:Uncharacterized protein n=1 Tax=Ilex paraguariensis TaxID=185542 RepID=A0ABC8RPH0_9AQUA
MITMRHDKLKSDLLVLTTVSFNIGGSRVFFATTNVIGTPTYQMRKKTNSSLLELRWALEIVMFKSESGTRDGGGGNSEPMVTTVVVWLGGSDGAKIVVVARLVKVEVVVGDNGLMVVAIVMVEVGSSSWVVEGNGKT